MGPDMGKRLYEICAQLEGVQGKDRRASRRRRSRSGDDFDNMVNSTYEFSKAKLVRPATVRFQMIFVQREEGADAQEKARELAKKLASEIGTNPSKFDEVSLRSHLPNSGFQTGDGGFLPRTAEAQQIVGAEFMNAAFALKVGEVSWLLDNPRGFQIIKVTETYAQKTLELSDPFQLGGSVTVREVIGALLLQQRPQKIAKAAGWAERKWLRVGRGN